MLPTLGGQDIDSRVSLRGFENYRFRAPDTMFVQAEYSLPVYDPFALLLFYDAGNVGNTLGDLSFANLRQDGGFGVNLRILRMTPSLSRPIWPAAGAAASCRIDQRTVLVDR